MFKKNLTATNNITDLKSISFADAIIQRLLKRNILNKNHLNRKPAKRRTCTPFENTQTDSKRTLNNKFPP